MRQHKSWHAKYIKARVTKAVPASKWNSILLFALFLLFVLIVFFCIRIYLHVEEYRSHREYLREPQIRIQPWMTMHTVARRFNISEETLDNAFHINTSTRINTTIATDKLPLETVCRQKHLNCSFVIDQLNREYASW